MNDSSSLENQLLIAMPQMQDPYFANTVTYLWKHNEGGALGIVLNKPLKASIADIFDELGIVCSIQSDQFNRQKVMAGGPVERDKGFILHSAGAEWDSSRFVLRAQYCRTSRVAKGLINM
jgi:putative transcriptional regulator